MPIVSDETGTYVPTADGGRQYATCTSFQMNGEDVFRFDQDSGVLSVSASPEDCEKISSSYGISEETPKDIVMTILEPLHFIGVKKIVSLPLAEGKTWILKV